MEYKNLKIEEFIELLQSDNSMPGGGTASSLVSSMGVALILKVVNLSIGKHKFKEYEDLLKKTKKILKNHSDKLLELMDTDANNFKAIEEVFKIKAESEAEKEDKKKKMSYACKICCKAPEEMIKISKEVYDLVDNLYGKTSKLAESDLNVAKIFLEAGIKGANENILINKKYIID